MTIILTISAQFEHQNEVRQEPNNIFVKIFLLKQRLAEIHSNNILDITIFLTVSFRS